MNAEPGISFKQSKTATGTASNTVAELDCLNPGTVIASYSRSRRPISTVDLGLAGILLEIGGHLFRMFFLKISGLLGN